jgi:hypothetical protein
VIAVEFAGELIAAGEVLEPAFAFVALVDDMDRAVRARGLAVGAGEPAARILHPQARLRAGIGPDGVLDAVAHALALVALGGFDDGVERSLVGLEQLSIGAAAADRADVADEQNVGRIGAPGQNVVLDVAAIERLADGGEDLAGIELRQRRRGRAIRRLHRVGIGGGN